MEESTVNERIKLLVEHFSKGNKAAFARAAGISNQSLAEILGARQSAPSFTALQKMLTAFPQVCVEWFVFGRGPMLRDEAAELRDTEGAIISPEEVEQLQVQLGQQQADLGRMQSDLNVVLALVQSFNSETVVPEKAKQIMKDNPSVFSPKK